MKQKRIFLVAASTVIFLLTCSCAAQDLEDFYQEERWNRGFISVNWTHIENQYDYPTFYNPLTGLTDTSQGIHFNVGFPTIEAGIKMRRDRTDPLAFHYDFRYPLATFAWEIVTVGLIDVLSEPKGEKLQIILNGYLSNGLLGFHNFGVNVIGTDELVVSAGINYSDYTYHLSYVGISGGEPRENGNYFMLGPYSHADVMLTKWLMARTTYHLSLLPIWTYDKNSDPKSAFLKRADGTRTPVFSFLTIELSTIFNLFLKAEIWNMFRRTDVDAFNRQSFMLGVRFHLSDNL